MSSLASAGALSVLTIFQNLVPQQDEHHHASHCLITMSTAVFGVTISTVAGGALAASAFAGAESRAAASLRAISSTALFGEGVRG